MSTAIGTRQCGHLGCARRAMTTANERADGPLVYAFCAVHLSIAMTHAFGPQQGGSRPLVPLGEVVVRPADRHAAVAGSGMDAA